MTWHTRLVVMPSTRPFPPFVGGAKGIRTPDPHTASVVRYQLRHSPSSCSSTLHQPVLAVQNRTSRHLSTGLRTERPGGCVLGAVPGSGLGGEDPAASGHQQDRPADHERPPER